MYMDNLKFKEEINQLLWPISSSKARFNAALRHIKNLGAHPVIINHHKYKTNKIILFVYEEVLFGIKIFTSKYQCNFCCSTPISDFKDSDLDSYNKKFRLLYGYNYDGYCLDTSFNTARDYMSYYNRYYITSGYDYYKRYYKISMNYFLSAIKLQILFEE